MSREVRGYASRITVRLSSHPEDLVLGLVKKGLTLSESILVSATSCERCMNVLAHECGIEWGYAEPHRSHRKFHIFYNLQRS